MPPLGTERSLRRERKEGVISSRRGITKSLARRIDSIGRGERARGYLGGDGTILASSSELAVSRLLQFAGTRYEYKKTLVLKDGSSVTPTFTTEMGFIVIDEGSESEQLYQKIRDSYSQMKTLFLTRIGRADTFEDIGASSVTLNPDADIDTRRSQSIFLDDPSFAFDYSHILPWTKKCSVLHGHTSAVLVEVIGHPKRGMVVDFGDVKKIMRDEMAKLDHKLFISRKYLVEEDQTNYRIRFDGINGTFDLRLPKGSTFLLREEATIENMADMVLRMLGPRMPENVSALGVYIYEGLNKGSHLLALLNSMD